MEKGFAVVAAELAAGCFIEVRFDIAPRTVSTINEHSIRGYNTVRHGTLILGAYAPGRLLTLQDVKDLRYEGAGCYRTADGSVTLVPVNNLMYLGDEARNDKRQILFGQAE